MKKVLAVLLAGVLTLGLSACGGQTAEDTASQKTEKKAYATDLAAIKKKGKLIIGLDDTFAPMGFRDENDKLVGFDIDLAGAVCKELGVKAEFQPIDWDAKELELSTGKIDCIWNGMSITPEREKGMSLSKPYLNNKIIIMTNQGVDIESKEDLGKFSLGTQADSSALETIKNDPVYDKIKDRLTEYKTYDQVIMDMQSERLDAMIVDEVLGQYKNTLLNNAFQVSSVDFGEDLYAIGFRKSDTELTAAVDAALKTCVENGTAGKISEKWFGSDLLVK